MKTVITLLTAWLLSCDFGFSQEKSRDGKVESPGHVEIRTSPENDMIILKGDSRDVQRVRKSVQQIDKMFANYVKYWGNGDFERISEEVYGVPFSLFKQDKTDVFATKKQVKEFLVETFKELERNNYGHSKTNGWEHYKVEGTLAVIEMNFTRYLKNGEVMGPQRRTATYILRKTDVGYRIVGMVPHTTVGR